MELVKNILQFGADINQTDQNGRTCLHIAVSKMKELNSFEIIPSKVLQLHSTEKYKNKSLKILHLLLEHGPGVNTRDDYRRTALHYSVEHEQLECTNMLLKAGADVNLLDANHETPLIIASRLYLNFHNMKSGVSREDISVYSVDYLAKLVASLITPAARVNIADRDGNTALHFVDQTDNVQLVERLLVAGGDVSVAANNKVAVLHLAAKNGSCDIMDILLNDPHISDVINTRMTTIHEKPTKRLKGRHVQEHLGHSLEEKIYFLDRNHRRSQVCLNNVPGKTALMVALEYSNEQTALKLLSRAPDLNVHSDEDYTALHFAAHGSCTNVVRYLLQAGCNVNKQTEKGHTPLMLAGNKKIALLLCDAGADLNLVDKNGDKALHLAIYRSQAGVAQALINKGAVIDGNLPEPLPPLVLAAALNEIAIVKMLLQAGANVNVLSSSGISPLMAAAACNTGGYNNPDVFQVLHEHGADFNMAGKKGRTALMYFIKHGDMLAYLETLVAFGTDLDVKDQDNKSALVYCLTHKHQHFQVYYSDRLLKAGANPVVGSEYRYLVGKHVTNSESTEAELILERILLGCFFNYLQMLVCNGIVLKGLNRMNSKRETENRTALMLSLEFHIHDVTKYLLATCYMTVDDLRGLRQFSKSERYLYAGEELKKVILAAASEPWPLVKLAFIMVSTMLGESPDRDERLAQTSLPPKLKELLMFQFPISFLPVNDWSKIPLCYDPVDYETLQRPRPLMYHWPMGINLVS
ncbi:serine/threonine-protein phosphatase 6 regulatory ankyrin repeat subunit B-like [Physella acuta]|uniref:serine/threonine-protein phosphatase 6 regulatory ankyrin repeat subunit B-like n=1 Tax=Physella acuta TaxID=109671 RepID=UPI0027DC7A86|nr:serine/threonine-protein phosphatase 6 regulatory ankyrin repeat subunit B-like [Physella acuta]XP_059175937.1 serine/threonine-protein phosphatase 6 regulatory ankyrin repeat subunit B-like [Physella acuta]